MIYPLSAPRSIELGKEAAKASPTTKGDESNNSVWTATVNLTPKSSNRSNFQILSISYTGGEEGGGNAEDGEDAYENDSWDDEEDDED